MLDEKEMDRDICTDEQLQDEALSMHQLDIAAATEYHNEQDALVSLFDTADGTHSDAELTELSIAATEEALEANYAAAEQWLVHANSELSAVAQHDGAADAKSWAVTDAALTQHDVAMRDAAAASVAAESDAATEWYEHAHAVLRIDDAHSDTTAAAAGHSQTPQWAVALVAAVTVIMQTYTAAAPSTAAAVTPATAASTATSAATVVAAASASAATEVPATMASAAAAAPAATVTATATPAATASTATLAATTTAAATAAVPGVVPATAELEQNKARTQAVEQQSHWGNKRCMIQ
jgi:trimeric autotransporter adhesin